MPHCGHLVAEADPPDMEDPWRNDASTSVSNSLEQVDLNEPRGFTEEAEPQADAESEHEAHASHMDSVSLEEQQEDNSPPAVSNNKGKSPMPDDQPTSRHSTAGAPSSNGHVAATESSATAAASASAAIGSPAPKSSSEGKQSSDSQHRHSRDVVNSEAQPTGPTVFSDKAPTQKKIEKSLKKSKAAPPVLDRVLSKTRQK